MLHIVYSPSFQQLHTEAVRHVCSLAAKGTAEQILIVPEQFSFDTEWKLCAMGGDQISRFAEVLSFTRLANRVFAHTGGGAIPSLDQSGRLIAMAGSLEQIRSRLKIYGSHLTKPEFLLQLLDIVDEFKGCGVDRPALDAARSHLTGPLAQKLEELELIVETYEALCGSARQDPASLPDRLRDALEECDYARGRQITVCGFTDFTAQELSVLEALLSQAQSLTVYLPADDLRHGQPVFDVTRKTAAQLRLIAGRLRSELVQAALPMEYRDTALQHLKTVLFSPKTECWPQDTEEILLASALSASHEAALAAGRVQALLHSGCRCRDIAVACTDLSVYGPMLENLFARFRIPGYFSGSRELAVSPVARAVLSALEAACCGMELDAVAEYLASGFSGLSRDQADRLFNYAYVWDLRGKSWEQPFTLHPDGFGQELDEAAALRLASLNAWRDIALTPLLALKQALASAENTAAQVQALADFLERLELEDKLAGQAARLQAEGQLQQAQMGAQLYEILLDTMEQIYGVLGQTVRSPEEFYRFFRAAVSQHQVGTIPASLDCVRVGSLPDLRNSEVRHLIVLGANDGLLPAAPGGRGLLTDQERRSLTQLGLSLAPAQAERLDRELLTACIVLTSPTDSLLITAQTGAESYLYTRIRALFPRCAQAADLPLPVRPEQAAQLLSHADDAVVEAALRRLPELADTMDQLQSKAGYTPGTLNAQTVSGLYGDQIRLSASKIDKFASCKYAYYLTYGLKAKERKQARIDAPLFGTFVHEVLERLVAQVQEEGGFRAVTEDRLNAITEELVRSLIAETLGEAEQTSPRTDYILRRSFDEIFAVVRELWQELRLSRFSPRGLELPFRGEQAITVAGQYALCRITGVVDRVDLFTASDGRTYLRVVDYKTGRKDFDYTDLLCGMGLQMLIYLFTLTDQSRSYFGVDALPAGVLYFPARYPVRPAKGHQTKEEADLERRPELRRKGLLLNDEAVIEAMEPGAEKLYLPVKYKKSKGEDPVLQGDLADPAQLELLRRHIRRSLGQMTDEIFLGQLAPNPYYRGPDHGACKWCEFKSVCHVDSGCVPLRVLRATKADRFWEELEREDEHGTA